MRWSEGLSWGDKGVDANGVLWLKDAASKSTGASDVESAVKSQGYTGIKFVEDQNHLFVDSSISGEKARLVIDSGAMVCLFKESAVKQFPFQVIQGRAVISGVGGPVEIKALAKTKDLQFAGAVGALAQDFYVMNMSKWPQDYTVLLDGVLGSDFLIARQSMIDYANNVLWIKMK